MLHSEKRREAIKQIAYEEGFHDGYSQAMSEMPEVVRCKYCKKNGKSQCPLCSTGDPYLDSKPNDNWYCADGEMKE